MTVTYMPLLQTHRQLLCTGQYQASLQLFARSLLFVDFLHQLLMRVGGVVRHVAGTNETPV